MGTRVRDARSTERRQAARRLQPIWGISDGPWSGRTGGRRWRAARRLLAVALLAAAGVVAALGNGSASGTTVVAVDTDLALGAVLEPGDLTLVLAVTPPDGALHRMDEAVGRRLAGAIRRGELITDLRLIGDDGPNPGPDRIAVAVRPDDPALLAVLQPGMAVAVIGVTEDGTVASLTEDALVMAVLTETGNRSPPVLLSVPNGEADRVIAATITGDIALQLTQQ